MAMVQVGMGLTRVVILVGAGVAGSVVLRNGRLSEIIGEIQEMLDKGEKGKGGDGYADMNDALTKQVRHLAMEVRQLTSSRPITILNGGSGQTGVSGLIVPAATVGALGYGYMWWKGISFTDLMYVTKRNMANAVSSMTKHLEQVQSSLAAAKRHLTQRIEKLDDKLDQQKALSGQIRDDVTDARLKLENIGSEIKNIKQLVWGLDEKMDSMEAKQGLIHEVFSKILRGLSSAKVTRPSTFRSSLDGYAVKSSLKAEDGLLYPLEKGFFFLPEPPTLILHEIEYVDFEHHGAVGASMSSQYFDLLVKLKNDQEHLFRNIQRNEYHNLFNFISGKHLKILYLGDGQGRSGVTAVLQSTDDDSVDPHLERIKNQAGNEESDEEDEDFVADKDDSGSPTDDSEEEGSDASLSGGEKENQEDTLCTIHYGSDH